MSSSFGDSVDQLRGDSAAAPTQLSEDGYVVDDSPIADYSSPPPIYVSGGGLSPDQPELSSFYSAGENGTPFEGENMASESDGPVLPPLSEMQPEEGVALREWRRQNALRLEEKEKMEKELLNQIIDEADEYMTNFHSKRKITCENNKATNREREKVYLAGRDKFHAEADKSYWKSIAELIPNEVPVIEKRGGKKEQDKKPSVVMIQGPKPGKPTELSRMRQILIKLKHNTPLHLKHSPPPPPAAKTDTAAAPAAVTSSAEAVAVA